MTQESERISELQQNMESSFTSFLTQVRILPDIPSSILLFQQYITMIDPFNRFSIINSLVETFNDEKEYCFQEINPIPCIIGDLATAIANQTEASGIEIIDQLWQQYNESALEGMYFENFNALRTIAPKTLETITRYKALWEAIPDAEYNIITEKNILDYSTLISDIRIAVEKDRDLLLIINSSNIFLRWAGDLPPISQIEHINIAKAYKERTKNFMALMSSIDRLSELHPNEIAKLYLETEVLPNGEKEHLQNIVSRFQDREKTAKIINNFSDYRTDSFRKFLDENEKSFFLLLSPERVNFDMKSMQFYLLGTYFPDNITEEHILTLQSKIFQTALVLIFGEKNKGRI